MTLIHDDVRDNGLSQIDSLTENLYLCSAEPTTFAQASSTYKLGTKAAPTIGVPEDGDTSGRKVVISAVTDGVVNTAGDATHWALTDDSGSKLLAAGALAATVALITGSPFTTTEFAITLPDQP